MANNKMVQDLINKVQKLSDTTLQEAAKVVEDELEDARLQILDQFYKFTKDGSGDLFNAVKVKSGAGVNNRTRAYMVIDSGGMANSYGNGSYEVSAGTVLDLIWNQGVRGLPEQGSTPLNKTYDYFGNHFEKREIWQNPYWDPEKYHNEFKVTLQIGSFKSSETTPKKAMEEYIENFKEKRMDEVIGKAFNTASKG